MAIKKLSVPKQQTKTVSQSKELEPHEEILTLLGAFTHEQQNQILANLISSLRVARANAFEKALEERDRADKAMAQFHEITHSNVSTVSAAKSY